MITADIKNFIETQWTASILPTLEKYIQIPNKSPHFDRDWQSHGHMEQAVELLAQWAREQSLSGMRLDIKRLPNRTPLLYIEISGQKEETVLLYGHLDKQPEMTGWRAPLGPWTPVMDGERLYGRGGADDGYALFASLCAIAALQAAKIPHGRCIILIEACEESGSYDLPFYLEALQALIGTPDLVICLDSGCGNYEQLWCTTSLRGVVNGTLKVSLLTEGIHSGNGSGVYASSFRIIRQLMSRLEDDTNGQILLAELNTEIPAHRQQEARYTAQILGEHVVDEYPIQSGVRAVSEDHAELLLNKTWRPALSVTGVDGIPAIADAGNVLRPFTHLKLSMRLPPNCNAQLATQLIQTTLTKNPPDGAHVEFIPDQAAAGWNAHELTPALKKLLEDASLEFFNQPVAFMGEGGSIPFIAMLAEKFPRAQFLITGVLGPHSNAHGPNEFLHIPTAKKLTGCVAYVVGGFKVFNPH